MKTYITKQGDMWDAIAYAQLGDVMHTDKLMNANQQHIKTYIFPAGIVLNLPEVSNNEPDELPPWKKVAGG